MGYGKENVFLVFEEGRGLEDMMVSKVFLLLISREEKSKTLLGPNIFFESCDEIEGRWLEPVFKVEKYLVGGLNEDGRSSLRWLRNLEEECEDLDRLPNVVLVDLKLDEIRCMKLACWKEDFEGRLDSSFLIEETDEMDEILCSLWKWMTLVGGHSF